MRISRLLSGVYMATIFCVSAGLASAASYSFTGTLATDDQLQEFTFTLANTNVITAVTYGYAGGTNQAGTLIPEGGFDPALAIFDSSGNLLALNDDESTCSQVPGDSMTGACLDSYLSESLGPGTYTLVLSQSGNDPIGNTLADGYLETGNPNYTAANGCSNGTFCDEFGDNRTGNFAVDIDNVTSASEVGAQAATPEPATVLLSMAGLAGLTLLRRRSRAAQELAAECPKEEDSRESQ